MAEVLTTHAHMSMDLRRDTGSTAPLPNPPFVFPMQSDEANEMSSLTATPSQTDTARHRRAASRNKPQRLSLNALPAFDFSPAASNPTNIPPSPSRSPSRRTPPAHHLSGHRRNGSEYIGGGLTYGGPVLVSTSPTKSENSFGHRRKGSEIVDGDSTGSGSLLVATNAESQGSLLPQLNAKLGPPITRGHAHRRSGAISSHDLSMILKPPAEAKGGSAPTTPSDPMFQGTLPPELDRSTSQPVLNAAIGETSPLLKQQESFCTEDQIRPRARFSEKIDYIPRPLSTISSETSSSMSTIRANHSVTNSISSVVGTGISNPAPNTHPTVRRGQTLLDQELDRSRSRPSTAEPLSRPSSGDWERDFVSSGSTAKRPSSAPSADSLSKRTEIPISNMTSENLTSVDQIKHSPYSKSAQAVQSPSRGMNPRRRPESPIMRPRTSPEPKVTKRQRKGRSWAGLLSRKGRHQEFEGEILNRRSPTPPLRQPSPEMVFSLDDINFDDDTTQIIETGSPYSSGAPPIQTNYASWKPRESSPLSETDNSASILDIDAALGSFDTGGTGPTFEEVVGGQSATTKRPMHSSGATGGFAGPGMHYHRRTESAPEMETIDRSKFGFPRLGSNPAMAIEEEEEEDDEEDDTRGPSEHIDTGPQISQCEEAGGDQAPGLGVNVVEADTVGDWPMRRASRRPVESVSRMQERLDELSPVEIVGADEEPRFSVITKSSDDSTITPSPSHDPSDTHPAPVSTDLTEPVATMTYYTGQAPSATSSPDFTKTSFEGPRMHTATSSITDRATLSSSRAGDQGLGLHGSIDDVPSLTSSASTMSAHPTRFSSSANSAADRSSSLSAAVPARTRPVSAHKRLSLASLSRLAGSSYNKSKLNIEESAPVDPVERAVKKRGNRISRMMKFWKSKEKLSSS